MDKRIIKIMNQEKSRQKNNIELIASENYVSNDVMKLQGSIFTNKYAEGYPGKRYYGGCVNMDAMENLAIEYICKLFKCSYANVQPHSGSSANMAVYRSLLNHKDKVLGMNLNDGGHLTHGHPLSFSGQDYEIISYNVNENGFIDYDALEIIALKEKPKMIIAGASSYSRIIDFKRCGEIAKKCGAYLFADVSHIAGLIVAGLHPSPFPYADVVTTTTHKTLRGPRGGVILTNSEELERKINKAVFPGIQGGPLMHVIAAKAECFYEALQPEFREYQKQILRNTAAMVEIFKQNNFKVVSNGSDNHLLLLDVKSSCGITGKEAENILDKINITVNKNVIPFDTESPLVSSGIRLGSPAMTSRGFKESEFKILAQIIVDALTKKKSVSKLKSEVKELMKKTSI